MHDAQPRGLFATVSSNVSDKNDKIGRRISYVETYLYNTMNMLVTKCISNPK